MLISREPVILEQKMSSFGKKNFIRTFIRGYCEVLNMKLDIWLGIPNKYIEDFYVIVCVIVGTFSERLTDTSCLDFFFFFFCISLATVKTDVKNVFLNGLFFQNWPAIFFSDLCYLPAKC